MTSRPITTATSPRTSSISPAMIAVMIQQKRMYTEENKIFLLNRLKEKMLEYKLDVVNIYKNQNEIFAIFNPRIPMQEYKNLPLNIVYQRPGRRRLHQDRHPEKRRTDPQRRRFRYRAGRQDADHHRQVFPRKLHPQPERPGGHGQQAQPDAGPARPGQKHLYPAFSVHHHPDHLLGLLAGLLPGQGHHRADRETGRGHRRDRQGQPGRAHRLRGQGRIQHPDQRIQPHGLRPEGKPRQAEPAHHRTAPPPQHHRDHHEEHHLRRHGPELEGRDHRHQPRSGPHALAGRGSSFAKKFRRRDLRNHLPRISTP